MSLPHLLLVDDSDAVLQYERAALSGHYAISTASDGQEALVRAREVHPAAILLDLSMPRMNGEEALAELKRDAALRDIPVIVVSAEHARGQACTTAGAAAFIPKPVRAEQLCSVVERVLAEDARRRREGDLAALLVNVGSLLVGIPLSAVREVTMMAETMPLPGGPFYLRQMLLMRGEPVAVLDLCARLGVPHASVSVERKLVRLTLGTASVALCVDGVRDPEEFARADVFAPPQAGEPGPLKEVVRALVRTSDAPLVVLEPNALVSARLLRRLPALLAEARCMEPRT